MGAGLFFCHTLTKQNLKRQWWLKLWTLVVIFSSRPSQMTHLRWLTAAKSRQTGPHLLGGHARGDVNAHGSTAVLNEFGATRSLQDDRSCRVLSICVVLIESGLRHVEW